MEKPCVHQFVDFSASRTFSVPSIPVDSLAGSKVCSRQMGLAGAVVPWSIPWGFLFLRTTLESPDLEKPRTIGRKKEMNPFWACLPVPSVYHRM